tara:strand:+ start:213 stop:317 length:105 start_codon:yes stop_codon:yes gene_type:complete
MTFQHIVIMVSAIGLIIELLYVVMIFDSKGVNDE